MTHWQPATSMLRRCGSWSPAIRWTMDNPSLRRTPVSGRLVSRQHGRHGPTHAQLPDRHGWTKADVKRFLWEHWGRRKGDLRGWGEYDPEVVHAPFPGAYSDGPDCELLRFGESPESLILIV